MAVDAVLKVLDPNHPKMLDLRDIKVVTKVGGTIDDSELVEGMVFSQKAAKGAGGPQRVEKAQIGLIQVPLSPLPLMMFQWSVGSETTASIHYPSYSQAWLTSVCFECCCICTWTRHSV